MDSTNRAAAEHAEVRVEGTRRRIAMRRSDWDILHSNIPVATHCRLLAAFKRFCAGCDNLPEQVFRRVASDRHGRLEEFVADGVQVIGRRGTDDELQTFFTTDVRIAADVPMVVEPEAPRQAALPLDVAVQKKGTE